MIRRSADSLPPARFSYPNTHQITLEGRRAGVVNFSQLPEAVPAEDVRMQLLEPLGPSLGAIVLPPQPGSHVVDTNDDRRRALRINAFRDRSAAEYGATAYILATDAALEQISQHSSRKQPEGPLEGEGIITLIEGDRFPVGRKYWLPYVGTHVELVETDSKLKRMYGGTHSDQGVFRVEDGELLYEDHGHKNRADLIHGGPKIEPLTEQSGFKESFVQTGRVGVAGAGVQIGSVFHAPAEVSGLHDATGH
jgi:hypothetical protein